MDRTSAIAILAVGLAAWFLPFPLAAWSRVQPHARDPRWRWGLILETLAYAALFIGGVRTRSPALWCLLVAAVLFAIAALLSWTATRCLGRYLRFEAAVDPDHQLIRSGPYRVVRHPIYASMLCLLLGIAVLFATPLGSVLSLALFVLGTEVRVRIEEKLLADHFGDEFRAYRRTTSAYIPLIR